MRVDCHVLSTQIYIYLHQKQNAIALWKYSPKIDHYLVDDQEIDIPVIFQNYPIIGFLSEHTLSTVPLRHPYQQLQLKNCDCMPLRKSPAGLKT